ncbi:MAG: hypothetical protein RQ872_03890 [Sulfolobaceae archaeon]|jgi:hypothetical protein|nr:hypothetical protein [Sulfolobaceae archaeon]
MHSTLVKQIRVIGYNIKLLSYTLKIPDNEIIKALKEIKNLKISPIKKVEKIDIGDLRPNNVIRVNIKGDKALLSEGKFKVVEIRNYSGKPDEYDFKNDKWIPNYDVKADYVSIPITEFNTNAKIKGKIKTLINNLNVRSFIVDYGKRDFFIDIITLDKDVSSSLEYFPFIRYGISSVSEEGIKVFFNELFLPEEYLNVVIKSISYMCESAEYCETLISLK